MKFIYIIGFIIVLPIHLILLLIIKIIELIGKGLCLINDKVAEIGDYFSDRTPEFQKVFDNLTLKIMKWKNK